MRISGEETLPMMSRVPLFLILVLWWSRDRLGIYTCSVGSRTVLSCISRNPLDSGFTNVKFFTTCITNWTTLTFLVVDMLTPPNHINTSSIAPWKTTFKNSSQRKRHSPGRLGLEIDPTWRTGDSPRLLGEPLFLPLTSFETCPVHCAWIAFRFQVMGILRTRDTRILSSLKSEVE